MVTVTKSSAMLSRTRPTVCASLLSVTELGWGDQEGWAGRALMSVGAVHPG